MEILFVSKPCLIIGCGSHCYSVISIIETLPDYEIVGLLDSLSTFDPIESKSGYLVVNSLAEVLKMSDNFREYHFAIAVGDNESRAKIYSALKEKGLNVPNFISKNAFVDRTASMGDANIIGHNTIVNAMVNLGRNNLINTSSVLEHNAIVGDHNHIAPMSLLCGNVHVSNLCLLGAGSRVLPNVSIADNVIIGAGSVLLSNVDNPNMTLFGNPAKEK